MAKQVAKRSSATRRVSTHEVQAQVEGVPQAGEIVDGERKVKLRVTDPYGVERVVGEYRIADKIGLMPLLKFAHVSSKGIDSADMEGLAAMYAMVRDALDTARPQGERRDPDTGELTLVDVAPSEFDRFERDAIESKADDKEIFAVVQEVMEALAARPTGSPSGSSPGRRPTSVNSKEPSPPTGTEPPPGMISVDSLLDR